MATFNQQGQTVHGSQYNAENITIGAIQNQQDFGVELHKFQQTLEQAIADKTLSGEAAVDAKANIEKAVLQTKEAKPEKSKLLGYLNNTKELVSGSAGLATALGKLISAVGGLF